MKIGDRDECRHCKNPILMCRIPGNKWLPFSLEMIEANPDAIDAFVPVRNGTTVALVPIADVAPRRLDGVRWYAQQHRCAEFMRTAATRRQEQRARRERVGGLGDVFVEHFDLD